MPDKPCRECGAARGSVDFVRRANWCVRCKNAYDLRRYHRGSGPRVCRGCARTKGAEQFHGTHRTCKACKHAVATTPEAQAHHRLVTRRSDARRREYKRARSRQRYAEHPELFREYIERAVRGSAKNQARRALTNAVRDGRVSKPDRCQRCRQETPRHRLHGHHHDYTKPFDVTWLCSICHGREHWKELRSHG